MYCDESAKPFNIQAEESVKIYKNVFVDNCVLCDYVTVGDDSRLINSELDEHVIIQRRNFIAKSKIGRFSSTMMDTIICGSTIGAFCSISYGVKVGGLIITILGLPHQIFALRRIMG